MRSCLLLPFSLVSGCVLLLLSASSAQSQCSANTIGFGDVGVVANNPFHADVTLITTGHTEMNATLRPYFPESVARDSQGRVRTERVAGEFKRDTGPDAGSKVELHLITICDPVAQTLTQIDTATLTARIIHSRPSATRSGALQNGTRRAFCSSRLSSARNAARFQVEDLGDQIIEGLEAHGERVTLPMLGATAPEESPNGGSTSERWCAESLSALVLTITGNTKTGMKTTIAMRNVDRTEPDPALFQIPPGYATTESVAELHEHRTPVAAQNDQQP
jgi:hypothetical protein